MKITKRQIKKILRESYDSWTDTPSAIGAYPQDEDPEDFMSDEELDAKYAIEREEQIQQVMDEEGVSKEEAIRLLAYWESENYRPELDTSGVQLEMKITKRQLQRIIREELEQLDYPLSKGKKDTCLDVDAAADVEALEDAWAGGDNLHHQIDHAKASGGEENSRGQELVLYITERRRRLKRKKQLSEVLDDRDPLGPSYSGIPYEDEYIPPPDSRDDDLLHMCYEAGLRGDPLPLEAQEEKIVDPEFFAQCEEAYFDGEDERERHLHNT